MKRDHGVEIKVRSSKSSQVLLVCYVSTRFDYQKKCFCAALIDLIFLDNFSLFTKRCEPLTFLISGHKYIQD